jgi:tripartite ATP-independent transporter DctM subunit
MGANLSVDTEQESGSADRSVDQSPETAHAIGRGDGRSAAVNRLPEQLLNGLTVGVKGIVAFAITVELIVVFANMVVRTFFNTTVPAVNDLATLMLTIVCFLGAAIAYAERKEMRFELLHRALSQKWQLRMDGIITVIVAVIAAVLCVMSFQLAEFRSGARLPQLLIPETFLIGPMVAGNGLMAVYALTRLALPGFRARLPYIIGTLLVAGVLAVTSSYWLGFFNLQSFNILLLAAFAVMLLAGVPLSTVFAAIPLAFLYGDGLPSMIVPGQMQDAVGNFILIALPFFIAAGLILLHGGMATHLSNFILRIFRRVPGGPYQPLIAGMMVFSGISGSKLADIVALGTMVKDLTEKERLNKNETAAVLAAAAVMGETIPPSIGLIVISSITTASTAALFAAGLGPAAFLALVLAILVAIRTRRRSPVQEGGGFRVIGGLFLRALPGLLLPTILIAGIVSGFGTPSEVSALAVVYGVVVTALVLRRIDLKIYWRTLSETAAMAGTVLYVIAAASAFAWMLTYQLVPQVVAHLVLSSIGPNVIVFMLISVALLIVLGAILEGLPAILILAPILFLSVKDLGISPVQFGIVLIMAMGMGAFMPPIGVGSYVAAAVADTSVEGMMRHMWPYIIVLILGILVVALVPSIALTIPLLLHLRVGS